jgi:hypothetical protein
MSEAIATTATNIVTAVPKNRTFKDLNDVISRSECYCLNENPNFPHGNLFMGDNTLVLKSDADGRVYWMYIEYFLIDE